jgi:hypothetical protein
LASGGSSAAVNEFHRKIPLTNFSSFIAFFHPSYSKDLIQELKSVGVCELPLAVVGNFLQLIRGDTESSELADDMDQQRQAF